MTSTALALLFLTIGAALSSMMLVPAANAQAKVPPAETQGGMNQAASRDIAGADAEMNRSYKKLMGSVNPKTRVKLRTSQRQWLKYRTAEAEFRSTKSEGGSVYPLVYAGNRAAITRARTKELNDTYKTFHIEGML